METAVTGVSSGIISLTAKDSNFSQVNSYRPDGTPSIGQFKSEAEQLIRAGLLRIADASNLLLMLAGVKPSSLVVCKDQTSINVLNNFLAPYFDSKSYHFDPDTQNFYLVIAQSEEKKFCLQAMECYKVNGDQVTGEANYHVELGQFLDVPDCCLVPRAVMPDEADRLFLNLKNSNDWEANSHLMRFSPHLPCSTCCNHTFKISAKYEHILTEIAPEYVAAMELTKGEKPLFLY